MLRSLLIYLSQAVWAQRIVMGFPLARRTALRFVAGETLEDALAVAAELNAAGMLATLDLLGEHTQDRAAAEQSTNNILDTLKKVEASGVRASLSIKLTQIGLKLDEQLTAEHLEQILQEAQRRELFVRIDMEEAAVVDATMRLLRAMREKGFVNVGAVIQSYLYRSETDVRELLGKGITIRLVKGAYKESPEVAFPKKADVDAAFDRISEILLAASKESAVKRKDTWPPLGAIASHDEKRLRFAEEFAAEIGLEKQFLEFQMLYGIRRELQRELADKGYPVRIYVPFGSQWYPYFMRRLAERPANLWFFVSNLVKR
ncbi:MAG: proline dehydrogenase family protein [Chloroflexi bacterium]|nr:proline dehydrogenase family protein [Chloroflexota bacterium]